MRNRRPDVGQTPSPCVKVCRLDADGFCIGCKRSTDEIRDWMIMSEYEQKKLLHDLMWRKDVRDNHS